VGKRKQTIIKKRWFDITAREMAFRASPDALDVRYPYTRIGAAQLDREEGVRTVRYGPYAILESA
jgi:hypothetical protein